MTRYAKWRPWAARLLAVAASSLVVATLVRPSIAAPRPDLSLEAPISDGALYASIVDRVRAGTDYYTAAADQHRRNGYPTRPATVFREPAEALLLAQLPGPAARWGALLVLTVAAGFAVQKALETTALSARARLGGVLAIAAGLSNSGMPYAPYTHELWASLFIVLSLCAYQFKRPGGAALLGLGACLVRELAFPYLLAMACMDVLERRWRDAVCWLAAAIGFAVFYAAHLHRAASLHQPGDLVSSGWVKLGGWPFVLLTARRNAFISLAPTWVVASVVVLSAIGLAGCRDRWITRVALVVLGYLAAVTAVGRPDNEYWGILWAPLLPLGLALAPAALRDLGRQAWPNAQRRSRAADSGDELGGLGQTEVGDGGGY